MRSPWRILSELILPSAAVQLGDGFGLTAPVMFTDEVDDGDRRHASYGPPDSAYEGEPPRLPRYEEGRYVR